MGSCVDSVVMDNRAALSSLLAEQGVCVAATPAAARGHHPASGHDRKELHQLGSWGHSPGDSVLEAPGREAALAWASLAQRSPASSLLAREFCPIHEVR